MKNHVILIVVFACLFSFNSYSQYDDASAQNLYKPGKGGNWLCNYAYLNKLDKVQSYINKGANVNSHSGWCYPLMYAVLNNNLEMADLLLKNGAKSFSCPDKHTGLLWINDYPILEFSSKIIRYSPFYYAVKLNQFEMVKKFCEYGYDMNKKISFSFSETIDDPNSEYAKKYGHDFKKVSRTQFSYPVVFASEFGNLDIFNYLIEKKVDFNVKDYNGKSPLMASVSANNLEIANKLLQMGCSVKDTSLVGFTPLMYATEVPGINFQIISSLIDKGADLNHTNSKNQSAFSLACLNNNQNIALFLIENGAKAKDSKTESEANAKMNHFLGDYYLAKGKLDSSKGCYLKGKQFYIEQLSLAKKEKSEVNAKKAGKIVGNIMLSAAVNVASASVGSMAINQGMGMEASTLYNQTKEFNKTMASAITHKKNPILLYNYKLPPEASLDEQKAYYKNKIKQFEMSIDLIDGILTCIDKGVTGEELNSCIEAIQLSEKQSESN